MSLPAQKICLRNFEWFQFKLRGSLDHFVISACDDFWSRQKIKNCKTFLCYLKKIQRDLQCKIQLSYNQSFSKEHVFFSLNHLYDQTWKILCIPFTADLLEVSFRLSDFKAELFKIDIFSAFFQQIISTKRRNNNEVWLEEKLANRPWLPTFNCTEVC